MVNLSNTIVATTAATLGDYGCENYEIHDRYFDIIRVASYSIIIIVSLIGNISVIACVYNVKSMRTFTNVLICNSAVADLLITLVPTVHEVADILAYKREWVLGGFMCSFLYMCVYFSVAATVLTLILVTVDRYCAVMLPYKKYLKVAHLPPAIGIIWVAAFLFSVPTTFIQKVVRDADDGKEYCMEKWPNPFDEKESPKHYTVILFVFLYTIPLCLMGYMYAVMANKLCKNSRRIRLRRSKNKCVQYPTEQNEDQTVFLNNGNNGGNKKSKANDKQNVITKNKSRKQTGRVIRMLMSVVISFAVCWLPVYIIQFFMFFHPYFIRCYHAMPMWASFLAFFMQYANSAVNPLIYFGFSRSYRNAFKQTFRCFISKQDKKKIKKPILLGSA